MISDDDTLKDDSALTRWNKLLLEASQKSGAPLNSALQHKQNLLDAGFTDVVVVEYKWLSNSWARDPKYKELGQPARTCT